MENTTIEQVAQEITSTGAKLPVVKLSYDLFAQSILTQSAFNRLKLPARIKIVGDFAQEGAIGYLFAPRGEGKTWMGLLLAKCIAAGNHWGRYKVNTPNKVLYIDGEMNRRLMLDRINQLPHESENLYTLCNNLLWSLSLDGFKGVNLMDATIQDYVLQFIDEKAIKVIFLDNLSCLCRGMKENEGDSWEDFMPFLDNLKQRGVLVIILHHTTKNGDQMRGTSRREDQADFVIRLTKLEDGKSETGTLRLKTEFTKNRNCETNEEQDERGWVFRFPMDDGPIAIDDFPFDKKQQVLLKIQQGLESCQAIAEELGLATSKVSYFANQLIRDGKVRKDGRSYVPAT